MASVASRVVGVGRRRVEPDTKRYAGLIAKRVRELRIERGLEVQEVADKTGIPLFTLYGYENGNREIPLEAIPKLAKALRCKTPGDFFPDFPKK